MTSESGRPEPWWFSGRRSILLALAIGMALFVPGYVLVGRRFPSDWGTWIEFALAAWFVGQILVWAGKQFVMQKRQV